MSTRTLPGGKEWLAPKANNLIPICDPTVSKIYEPRRLTTLWDSTVCYRNSFTFTRQLSDKTFNWAVALKYVISLHINNS
jgi:hypothetical protein